MRALLVAVICSSAILGRAAFADPAQDQSAAAPSAPAQSTASSAPAAPAPAQSTAVPAAPASTMAAESAPAAVPAQSASAGVDLNEIVCRNEAPATGTRLGGGRECHTVREWNERERESQDVTRREQAVGFNSGGR